MRRAATLAIRTPEGVLFSLPLASPVSRGLALTIDVAVVVAGGSLLRSLLAALAILSADIAAAAYGVAAFALSVGYAMAAEWLWRGQTIGKRLLRLRVVDAQGLKLQPAQVVVRNLLRPVDALPVFYLVGGAAALVSARAQRLGDLAANTVVVRTRHAPRPDVEQLLGARFNSLAEAPHLVARLKQRVSPEEATIALRAVLRRDRLSPEARVALFGEVAAHLKELVPFPPELVEGLSDEQYVRNAVELLFRERGGSRPA